MITPTRLKSVRGLEDATELLQELGFGGPSLPVDAGELGLGALANNRVLRRGKSRSRGHAVFVAEVQERPQSLKALGKRLVERFHDRPLAVVGVTSVGGSWERFIVLRPRLVPGVIGAVRVSKLEVDVSSPTWHDVQVLSSMAWSGDEKEAHERIDRALDAEAVTRRFYLGLTEHHQALIRAVGEAADAEHPVHSGVKDAGGAERVALRILTQVIFCWFLQRKRLFAGDPDYLIKAFRRRAGNYYQGVLEPLFYDALAVQSADRKVDAPGPEIPFLNGGLFVRHYGDTSLPLPDSVFDLEDGLLGFLSRWTFTVAEDVPEETEVAVDPEMLGKVFENLITDEEAKKEGTVYTPRPVVHFMCREALVCWLQDRVGLSEEWARRLLVEDHAFEAYGDIEGPKAALEVAERLDREIRRITVLDPAVGSGAFLLGMLAEVIRLHRMILRARSGRDAHVDELRGWKLHAIERSLFGVDINPIAIELCRLRLWLALVVDLPEGITPQPLPNLEYRTIVANSLTDFVNAIRVQNTSEGQGGFMDVPGVDAKRVVQLRHAFFRASPETKEVIRAELADHEDNLIPRLFEVAHQQGDRSEEAQAELHELRNRFGSWDRSFPVFMPGFHSPEVWKGGAGGWDITIMNPPYLGRKEIRRHLDPLRVRDYERHFGVLNDVMILFARRARQLTRSGGTVSMIFNDSIFTSTDAEDFRCELFERERVRVCARTKCFEGKAVNGGVVVAQLGEPDPPVAMRWVEGYRRPPADFASASDPLPFEAELGRSASAGQMEVFSAPGEVYRFLPHSPLYRPSREAIRLLGRYAVVEPSAAARTREGWQRLSNTPALNAEIKKLRDLGWYERLQPGQWVPLGYVVQGGVGLQTADDKRFIGAVAGTQAAEKHLRNQERLEELVSCGDGMSRKYERRSSRGLNREEALLALWDDLANDQALSKLWPRGATFRVARRRDIRRRPLTEAEREHGISSGPTWVPFEKCDASQEVEGEDGKVTTKGAQWVRENPLVIDWSCESVRLLRKRARGASKRRKPFFRNEQLWGTEGVTWNSVASFLRCRRVPARSIFGHMAPTIAPTVDWMSADALLALLNTSVIDFLLRTFLGSRMHIEIGDVRRVPVPVLSQEQNKQLGEYTVLAVEGKLAADGGEPSRLAEVEADLDAYVRDIYGISKKADLWVVR